MCKYCGKSSIGNICSDCMEEQNSILLYDEECESLNMVYAIWGLCKFLAIIASIIITCVIFFGEPAGTGQFIAMIVSIASVWFFGRLRKMYNRQLGFVIDREMKKRHNK